MNSIKEIVREKLSEDRIRALDASKVEAIAFAEVGAQGDPNYIAIVSADEESIRIDEGYFGYEAYGRYFLGSVAIESIERVLPFLRNFRGTAMENTVRGHCAVTDEWIHLDALMGNHFFVRKKNLDSFLKRLNNRCICPIGIDIIIEMLKEKTIGGKNMVDKGSRSMIGAIVGDIVGSRFEWHNRKSKRFTFLKEQGKSRHPCFFTDDSVMTLAVAAAILDWRGGAGDLGACAVRRMQEFGRRFPDAGYGGYFYHWLHADNPQPYNSWGNGSAMRVSACGWAGRTLDEVKALSRAVTEVTHNHPEGIKGAEATAVATFLARTGKSMEEIKEVVVRDYYPLDFTLDEIRPGYEFDVSCQGSVPPALEAFFESTSFEDAIRNAISIGGDSDTIAAITGAVAGAYYGVPEDIREKAETFLDAHLLETLYAFERNAVK